MSCHIVIKCVGARGGVESLGQVSAKCVCECADFESLFSKVARYCFPLCIKVSCYIVLKMCWSKRWSRKRERERVHKMLGNQ